VPWGRRRFEGLHIVGQVIDNHPEAFGDLLVLLQGLVVDVFDPNNHVTPVPDPEFPCRLSAPFDAAVLIFKLEDDDLVVRLLQTTFWRDFVPN
jgi:hypothetical protein